MKYSSYLVVLKLFHIGSFDFCLLVRLHFLSLSKHEGLQSAYGVGMRKWLQMGMKGLLETFH